jgi:hypothetical protein
VFLGELGRRVHVARIHRGVLADQPGREGGAAHRAGRLEAARVQVGDGSRAWPYDAVPLALVPPLPVHHHRPGQHQPPYTRVGHGAEQHGRTEVVAGDVLRGVGEPDAEADHRGLVAHGVDAGQGPADGIGAPHVRFGVGADVVHDSFVPARRERLDGMGPDEPGTAGDQYAHALTLGRREALRRLGAGHVTGP